MKATLADHVYRKAHLPLYAKLQRQWRSKHPKDTLIIAARSRARKFALPCDITTEDLEWPSHCPVLGIELDYNRTIAGNRKLRSNYPTLDRRDNSKGYVKGNVFVISHRANRIKSDATVAELKAVADYAAFVDP